MVFNITGISAFGIMGLDITIRNLKHQPRLITWYQAVAEYMENVPNGTLFLGLRLQDKGEDLAADKKLADDLFQTLRDMKINFLVLVTHNAEEKGNTSCTTIPVSSWSAKVYKDATAPALEHMLKFLEYGLRSEKAIEVALSSTLAMMTFRMKAPILKPVHFGDKCESGNAQFFYAYCFKVIPNEQEHTESVTALGFEGNQLWSFETPQTVEKKIRRFVFDLDDKVFRRVGWAFFDLGMEAYNNSICPVKNTITKNFPRLAVAKPILTENRNRRFNVKIK